jgi:hypothetical protein
MHAFESRRTDGRQIYRASIKRKALCLLGTLGWQEDEIELVRFSACTPDALTNKIADWIKQPDKDMPTWDECGNRAPVEPGDLHIETEPLPDETLVEQYFNWYEPELSSERMECIIENDPKPTLDGEISASGNARVRPLLHLYFVDHEDDVGYNLNLFVWSKTSDGVADQWRTYFELDEGQQPDRIFEIPIGAPKPGPVRWYSSGEVSCVFDRQGRGGARD